MYFCDTFPLKAYATVFRNVWWLPAVWSDSPQYDTARRLTPAVSYCGKIDSAQYHTAGSQSRKTRITRRNLNQRQNRKYFNPFLSSPGRIELWNKTGRKSRWTVPLNRIRKSHMTPCSMILRGDWLSAVWYRLQKYPFMSIKTPWKDSWKREK